MASLEQIHALVDELIQQAKSGALVPVRLPGQLEAVKDALNALSSAASAPVAAAPAQSGTGETAGADDPVAEVMKEQAKFISHAVHELRTPMTSIRGYADMLTTMGQLNEMQKQFAETIRSNARRMEGLLTDVSDISKIRGGTLRYALKMDMYKNVAMMVEKQMQPIAESLGRSLTFDTPQGLPLLNTDGELLAKALCKLVENALRYCEDQCAVTVRAKAENNTLFITIEDNGIGMSPEDLAQLGTIYFRSENEVVRSHKGSGLGIPVAYGILKLLNGTVAVKSEPGVGTTFTISLPGMQ
ncbi:MAG: HAMP domain-containing histidine kinase [Anaerolineae bacterium]|nr:HAMP domain-containing histidine kinase [Anaerolineae bacterium]